MVRSERLAVLLVSENDVPVVLHRTIDSNRGTVRSIFAFRKLFLWPAEADELGALFLGLQAALFKERGQANALPDGRSVGGGTPREAQPLLDHVLFFTAVSGAREGYRELVRRQGYDLIHGEHPRVVDKALDSDLVVFPLDLRDFPVVADEVDLGWGDEARVQKILERWLAVKGMASRKADERGVALNPSIGSSLVPSIDLLHELPRLEVVLLRLGLEELRPCVVEDSHDHRGKQAGNQDKYQRAGLSKVQRLDIGRNDRREATNDSG
mmetsp:Transcript_14653/g.29660  ORF Transcript_14653/g.29660 Transcript_14653/m.29660 type:complete len:268 (+) Transcript_14653:1500-2303(+)